MVPITDPHFSKIGKNFYLQIKGRFLSRRIVLLNLLGSWVRNGFFIKKISFNIPKTVQISKHLLSKANERQWPDEIILSFSLYFSIGFNLAPYPLRTNLYQSYNTQISLMTFKIADLNSLSLHLEVGLFFCQSVASERFSSDQSQGVFFPVL